MGIIIQSNTDLPKLVMEDIDRIWFEDHPDRFLYLRRPTNNDVALYGGEVLPGALPSEAFVLTFCPFEGMRWQVGGWFNAGSEGLFWLYGALHDDTDLVPIADGFAQSFRHVWGEPLASGYLAALRDCAKRGARYDDWMAVPPVLRLAS